MRKVAAVMVGLIGLIACQSEKWERVLPTVERRLLGFGDEQVRVVDGRYAELSFHLASEADPKLLCNTIVELLKSEVLKHECPFLSEEIVQLTAGDSMLYRGGLSSFMCALPQNLVSQCLPLIDTSRVLLTVAVRAVYDSSTYMNSPRSRRIALLQAESTQIEDAMRLSGHDTCAVEWMGVRYCVLNRGTGASARQGEEVVISYKGMTLDGRVFDNATDSLSWLYFPYGKPDQVVRGLELAVSQMKPGERRLLWLTSDLAFGQRGSRGIVGPNTPVVFDLTLQGILRNEPDEERFVD